MSLPTVSFDEGLDHFFLSGTGSVIFFKNSGDILVGRPFPIFGVIDKSSVISLQKKGANIHLLWLLSGTKLDTILGNAPEDCASWLEKINALYK